MGRYIAKRIALLFPTVLTIILINFTLVQFVPGGPIEQIISSLTHSPGQHAGPVLA